MTLQQLRYLIEISKCGSFNSAAGKLFISQSTLSTSIKDLENELGISIFIRNNRGLKLTNDGAELLVYARQVVEQADLLQERYASRKKSDHNGLAISTQHYAFCVRSFIELVNEFPADQYDFTLRETRTIEIINDVRDLRSDLGVLYVSRSNERALLRTFDEYSLSFSPLFEAQTHVFLGAHHPLAQESVISLEQLDEYPRYSFEQGASTSFHYAEEPLASIPHRKNITYSDRGTLTNLLTHGNGYTLSTGVLSNEMQDGIVPIPLDTEETMTVGYLTHTQRVPSKLALAYVEKLKACINDSNLVTVPLRKA